MTERPLTIGVVAGEISGDLLGGDLIAALRVAHAGPVALVGVGGEALERQGLQSLFDFSELSIMGISQVLKRLPSLIRRIRQTADALIAARPDALVIIDSPDFTHRVARRVRKALPDLPVVNYVCPSVWAWKEERAPRMRAYVDHVLALLPFEPAVMERLGGPATTYVGHRLIGDPDIRHIRAARLARAERAPGERVCLLLPGSRGTEITRLLPVFGEAAREITARNPGTRFLLPTVPRQEALVRKLTADWPVKPQITVSAAQKWQAFTEADAAIAASGTVILELALARVPVVSTYRFDWLANLFLGKVRIWTAAIPNIIADYAVVPEYLNDMVRPGSLTRWFERLSQETMQRRAMLEGYDLVHERMQTGRPPGETGAAVILDLLTTKKPGRN
ncbi:lipid-A-disaccharide synthase [Shinella yambaruensis]|uniref:Lipid-A-disaccharide synthase n=1 Tax=Shinella yambaruensis TaxID=415996 RepID=A0ABQ5ZKH6_9HYPH|nr:MULTISPECIES: lipid-A-disaccharide synthase [Shinella]MCJ8024032.1 lipid-A-disaccharide synthase [Shinella yambaruensis]MCU7978818.1 lipid-A-disaccharide synthase [Shinella yambaruensis]MCW5705878.1 lipid-A-disaccharide synthase [Shinella sp.]GLR53320.1 lipid-A-disaccharide synthase [Shinella yambaruensis]